MLRLFVTRVLRYAPHTWTRFGHPWYIWYVWKWSKQEWAQRCISL